MPFQDTVLIVSLSSILAIITLIYVYYPQTKKHSKGQYPGLVSFGNTCYINCILQAVSSCNHFLSWCQEGAADESHTACKLYELCVGLNTRGEDLQFTLPLSSLPVIDAVRRRGWNISNYQQDCCEFYQALMQSIEDDLEMKAKLAFPLTQSLSHSSSTQLKRKILHRRNGIKYPDYVSLLDSHPFRGLFKVQKVCSICKHIESSNFETFSSISLTVPRFGFLANNLQSLLKQYFATEMIQDIECGTCTSKMSSSSQKQRTPQKRTIYIARFPKCLCLQLQRTCWSSAGEPFKFEGHVSFPRTLSFDPYAYPWGHCEKQKLDNHFASSVDHQMSGRVHLQKQAKVVYVLKAVVVHLGSFDSGHFVTYRNVTSETSPCWIAASDEDVHSVQLTQVLQAPFYLLFYERRLPTVPLSRL